MYPLVPLPLPKTRLVLSQHAFVDENGCIMRCAMKRGAFASSRFWWDRLLVGHARHVAQHLPGCRWWTFWELAKVRPVGTSNPIKRVQRIAKKHKSNRRIERRVVWCILLYSPRSPINLSLSIITLQLTNSVLVISTCTHIPAQRFRKECVPTLSNSAEQRKKQPQAKQGRRVATRKRRVKRFFKSLCLARSSSVQSQHRLSNPDFSLIYPTCLQSTYSLVCLIVAIVVLPSHSFEEEIPDCLLACLPACHLLELSLIDLCVSLA
jgi:hypothetical protein